MEKNEYHIGNTAQSKLLLKELLPTIESLILNATKEFYSVREAMQILSVSRTQLYYLRKQKLLAFKHVGRKVYISRQAIHDLVMNEPTISKNETSSTKLN